MNTMPFDQFSDYKVLLALRKANPSVGALRVAVDKFNAQCALAGKPPLHFNGDTPTAGYYRLPKEKGAVPDGVAIFQEGDEWIVTWGNEEARLDRVWSRCFWHPVPYEWFEAKVYDGKEWPDIDQALADAQADAEEKRHGIGGNEPPDEFTLMVDEIKLVIGSVDNYKTILDEDTAKRAQTLRARLLDLYRVNNHKRDALVRPHLDAQNAINARWQPPLKQAKDGADKLKVVIEDWGTRKRDQDRAEWVKAQEALEAEQARVNAALEAQAESQGLPRPEEVVLEKPEEPKTTMIKGAVGRGASMKDREIIDQVTDVGALAVFLCSKDSDLLMYIMKKAQRVLDATGEIPPGTTTKSVVKVK